ncbi:uncharacterized protein FA14DRAFT_160546 [Meira miltonrushii]|uniref:Uncharacterized protein n=1 Tax=Meira miltonrushii TaxID=1280837 RepID=A0A316VD08_9BASI|nr:uncharacterized protein FA14DRAFT_160546 [Meira miltonrushii]PWN35370.1 hypothetical protein FA14DRAFT_160546 [Meira miltonrushii]
MSVFTQNAKLTAESNPRDWAYELACLPANASIVFTKDSFLRFLKTHNIDVSPNYIEINKLPKYAQIGTMASAQAQATTSKAEVNKLTNQIAAVQTNDKPRSAPTPSAVVSPPAVEAAPAVAPVPIPAAAAVVPSMPEPQPSVPQLTPASRRDPTLPHNPDVVTPDGEEFRPTRRVREPIGGGSAQITALFGAVEEEDYTAEAARESARRRGLLQENTQEQNTSSSYRNSDQPPFKTQFEQDQDQESVPPNKVFRPSRRVREPGGTGGSSSIALG